MKGSLDYWQRIFFISTFFGLILVKSNTDYYHAISIPALAYPTTVFINDRPEALAEYTISKRDCGVTGIDNPVVNPLLILPIDIVPVSAGARFTTAPGIGTNKLLGVLDTYNCAVIVIVEPRSDNAAVVLK